MALPFSTIAIETVVVIRQLVNEAIIIDRRKKRMRRRTVRMVTTRTILTRLSDSKTPSLRRKPQRWPLKAMVSQPTSSLLAIVSNQTTLKNRKIAPSCFLYSSSSSSIHKGHMEPLPPQWRGLGSMAEMMRKVMNTWLTCPCRCKPRSH